MGYLLDTNIVSDLVRNPKGRVAERIAEVGETQVRIGVIVAAELRFGVARRNAPRLTAWLEGALERLEIVPLAPPVDRVYGTIRTRLERAGRPIGANDLLIAAQAIALQDTLVTDNLREFERIEELKIENWLRDPPGTPAQ